MIDLGLAAKTRPCLIIGRTPEDLDWQRAGLEKFFADDFPEDEVYDSL